MKHHRLRRTLSKAVLSAHVSADPHDRSAARDRLRRSVKTRFQGVRTANILGIADPSISLENRYVSSSNYLARGASQPRFRGV